MKSRGLRVKSLLIAGLAGVAFTAALLAIQFTQHRQDRIQLREVSEQAVEGFSSEWLEAAARDLAVNHRAKLAAALDVGDMRTIERIGKTLLNDPRVVEMHVADADGKVVYATSRDDEWAERLDPADAREVSLPLGDEAPVGALVLRIAQPGMKATAQRIAEEAEAATDRRFYQWLAILGSVGLGLTGLAIVVGWRVGNSLEQPITELIRSAERMGEGDYSQPLSVTSRNEIADLEQALDRMRQKLRQTTITTNYLTTVLNSMNDAVLVTSPEGAVKKINEAAVRLFGYTEQQISGRPLVELIADNERASFSIEAATNDIRETVIRTQNGQTIPVSLSGSPISATDPQFQGTIFVVRNITDRKRAERRIRYLARYDSLTKIPNRMQFQHMLQQSIARARRSERGVLLLYLDMDRFKEINDTFGHAAGDRSLEVLSERLTRTLPKEAVIGRLAGDEFALFIEGMSHGDDDRAQAANLARMVLAEVSKAFYVQHHEVFLTASIGIAFCPRDAENVIDLIRNADAAMYHSKQNGGNSFAFYTPEMNAAAVERLMLKSKLRRALERDELVILYQPKVDLRDGRIVGGEALLRWRLPGHGDISPSQFIPLAEETNLILGIGEWVLNRVCADYHEWQKTLPNPGRISINLSLKQLRQASFITRCRSVFRRHEVSPTSFELEITETTLMQDPKRTVKMLNELYSMGLHLSIDDFGTGYSSLSALQQFPIGTLKIDQSFVRGVSVDTDDATIVRTIIDMGKSMDMDVIAEGVENEDQLAFLKSRGCHFAQGRLFGDAMGAEEFLALMAAQENGSARVSKLLA